MIEVFNKEINLSIERFVIIPLIASPGIHMHIKGTRDAGE